MRYRFILRLVDQQKNILPVNYQFELGSWIYRVLNNPVSSLNSYLRTAGYVSDDEPFRHFVFSHLSVPDRKIEKDRLTVQCDNVSLVFSTVPDPLLIPLVTSEFLGLRFMLGDRISQVGFEVEKIIREPEPVFTDKMTFRTLSPLHLPVRVKGRRNELFLSPDHPDYSRFFYEDLHRKFEYLKGHPHPHDPSAGKFKLRSDITKKGILMHSGKSGQCQLIGYQLRFRLHEDPELLRAGYYLGFGEKNHLGFGCCENL